MRTTTTVRRVAEAVVGILCEPLSHEACRTLATLEVKEWRSSYRWLDANGLALYLRDVVQTNQLERYIPQEVLERFDQNHADNTARVASHLAEFRVVNRSFQDAGIRYANLKGFTLEPDYCADVSRRHQCDLDFMVHRDYRHICRTVLEELGYNLTVEGADTLEFKPREDQIPEIANLYKPRRQQAVEVHFGSALQKLDLREDCLSRITWVKRFGTSFPCLSQLDTFFSLVFHLYRHLLSEWVRLSWFYELAWFIRSHASDVSLWSALIEQAEADGNTARALALVLAFCRQAFNRPLPEPLAGVCAANLSRSTQLWVAQYGPEMLFSDFPGNKLYLLLLSEISADQNDWQDLRRKRLLPFHRPARVLFGSGWIERTRHIPGNSSYGLSRVRFHVREGFRYLREQWRWKRRVAHAALLESGSE